MSAAQGLLVDRLGRSVLGRDESVFIAAADFFSLLSICTIYALVVIRSGSPGGSVAEAAHPVEVANISAQELVTTVLYVALEPGESTLNVKMIPPPAKSALIRTFALTETEVEPAASWAAERVGHSPVAFEKIICYLPASEDRALAHKFLNEIVRRLQQKYVVQIVI